MNLREKNVSPDFSGPFEVTINNPKEKEIGIKVTEKEIIILSQKGTVVGLLDNTFFKMTPPEGVAKSPELARKKTAKSKPETKAKPRAKRTVKK